MDSAHWLGFLLLAWTSSLCASTEVTKVSTPLGDVLGRVIPQKSLLFAGVPYAEAPVGDLRFRLPRSPAKWNSTLNATEYGASCYQIPVGSMISERILQQSEDCLHLDIYVDGNRTDPEAKMPVMVYIHGGGFILGSSVIYKLQDFVAGKGIIGVVIQYRLGMLGFSQSPDDETIPGNLGLHDQLAAIKWVKEYISYFGGDPESITLAGESAGSISVAYQLVSPLSAGLFNRAILMSGAQDTIKILSEERRSRMMELLINRTNCHTSELDKYECLRQMPIRKLNNALFAVKQTIDPNVFSSNMVFVPTVDKRFFDGRNPSESILNGSFATKLDSLLIGTTGNEGGMFLAFKSPSVFPLFDDSLDGRKTRAEMDEVAPTIPEYFRDVYKQILDLAFDDRCRMNTRKLFNKMGKILGDLLIGCPSFKLTESLARANNETKIYMYHYVYRRQERNFVPYITEAIHADEVPFVFGRVVRQAEDFTPKEIELSRRLMDNWTYFVKTGKVSDEKWSPFKITGSSVESNHIAFVDPINPDYRSGLPENYCRQLENPSLGSDGDNDSESS